MNPFDDDEDDDEDDEFQLQFHEALGENILSDDVRKALVWASIVRFLDEEAREAIDESQFSDKHKALSKSVMFHGPFEDFEKAEEESQKKQAVIVAPTNLWTDDSQPVWLACLSN